MSPKPFLRSLHALPLLLALPALAGGVKGRVLLDEKPLAGATVSAIPYETPLESARREARRAEEPRAIATATTGPDGVFHVPVPVAPGKPPVLFVLRVDGPGAAPALVPGAFDAADADDAGDVAVRKAAALSGRVVDRAGEPVAGAEVALTPGTPRDGAAPALRTTTAPNGAFRFDHAAPDGNTLSVEAKGQAARRLSGLRPGALPRPIALVPAAAVTGTLRKTDRKTPASGALVRLERPDGVTRWVETDADGRFTLGDATAEPAVLVADAGEDGFALVRSVRPGPAGGAPLVVDLVPPAALEGRVVDVRSGKPVPRVKVTLGAGSARRFTRSGPDGRFRFRPLPADEYLLEADDPRYVPYRKRDLALLRGEVKKLDVLLTLGASLSGRVVDEEGRPVEGAKGSLARGNQSAIEAMLRSMRDRGEPPAFRSRPDGTFVATRLYPGEGQRLSVSHPDHERAVLGGLALPAGGEKAGLVVTLPRGLSIAGVVRDADGQPVAGAELSVSQSQMIRVGRPGGGMQIALQGAPDERPKGLSGPDGRFVVKGLAPGDYALRVKKTGYATESIDPVKVAADAPVEPLAITLAPGAAIAGTVRRKDGRGVEGAFVNARPSGRPGPQGLAALGDSQPAGPDGSFVLEGLRAGESYDLSVLAGLGMPLPKKGVPAPAEGVEITVAGTGRIAGRVVDAKSGQPIPEFSVSYEPARRGGMVMRIARAGRRRGASPSGESGLVQSADGTFVLEEVQAGTWDVVVEAKGYQTARAGNVTVEEGATRDGVEVRASLGSAVRGRVTDGKSGRPVPEASVSLVEAGGAGGPGMGMRIGALEEGGGITTDAEGRFEVEGQAPGKYTLEVKHPDFAEASQGVEVKDASVTTADVALSRGGSLGGAVVSDSRQPVAGAEVSLTAAGEGGMGRGFLAAGATTATTDEGGRFRFDHLGPGRYTAVAQVRGKSSPPVSAVLQSGESREDLLLLLAAGTTLRGVVSGLPEAQRAGVNVSAFGSEGFSGSARTGADGRFEISGAPAGTVSLRANAGDLTASRSAAASVTVPEGQPFVDVEIVFEGNAALSGRVTRGGQPVGNVLVQVVPRGGGAGGSGRTDEDGRYRVEGLEPSTYQVMFQDLSSFGGSLQTREARVDGDSSLDVDLPLARLAGTVVEAGTRQPLADVVVTAAPASGASGGVRRQGGATTDSSGRFSLTDVDPGSYTVTFRRGSYEMETRAAQATESGGDELVVELVRGEGLGLRVRDGLFGVPLRGVTVRVRDAGGANVLTSPVSLDGEGRGEISSLRPGTYTLSFEANGYAVRTFRGVMVPAPLFEVALTPGGAVELRAGPKTLEVKEKPLLLTDGTGGPHLHSLFGPEGRLFLRGAALEIDHLQPGSYTVAGEGVSKSFTVTEGGRTVVELP